jgi:3-dehydroquinate synthase
VVEKDELDRTGERAILNLGHTVGHAIERASDYRTFLHGEAISLGMVAACNISMRRAGLPKADADAITDLLHAFGLPVKLPVDVDRAKLLEAVGYDKKFEDRKVRFVVTPKIGSARLTNDVTTEDIREAVEAL